MTKQGASSIGNEERKQFQHAKLEQGKVRGMMRNGAVPKGRPTGREAAFEAPGWEDCHTEGGKLLLPRQTNKQTMLKEARTLPHAVLKTQGP